MRFTVAAALSAILAFPVGAPAQSSMGGMDMKGGSAAEHRATGTVSKVDQAGGQITIAHEAIPSISWPAMTMTFKAKERALLNNVKAGQKVSFTLAKSGNEYVVTNLK
jgi:Cu(I)/Ag(I) efflux system protein CusF